MIANEGKIILIPSSILLLILGFLSLISDNYILKFFFTINFLFVLFSLYFFRDPIRNLPKEKTK